jgi:putative mycofactocin binding protein MftB
VVGVAEPVGLVRGPWRLSPSVSLRPEPFGALLYDFGTRRLSFLKTPQLVAVVRALETVDDADTALTSAGVADQDRPAYVRALDALARAGTIEPRPSAPPTTPRP